jgi:hypothetical protein
MLDDMLEVECVGGPAEGRIIKNSRLFLPQIKVIWGGNKPASEYDLAQNPDAPRKRRWRSEYALHRYGDRFEYVHQRTTYS